MGPAEPQIEGRWDDSHGAAGNLILKSGGMTWDHGRPNTEVWWDDMGPRGT